MNYDWPKNIEEKVIAFADKKGLKGKKREKFIELAYKEYLNSLIPVYEAVGFLAAHSMAEPATQLILRTKHYAGAAEVSIGSGMERLEEIVDARAKTKSPTMTIYLKNKDYENIEKYRKQLIFKQLKDVAEIKENLHNKTITIKFKKEELKEFNLVLETIVEKIKANIKQKPKIEKDTLIFDFDGQSLMNVRKYFLKLQELGINGINGVKDAIIEEDENGEKIIKTEGTNLKALKDFDFIDLNRSYTNDILETYKVFGIEAARALIYEELKHVYELNGISEDRRHLLLLSDAMCYDGTVKGIVRTGIVSQKSSPLARAAFEQAEKVLFDAAYNKEEEHFNGVVENVMAGLPIRVGVGNIDLSMEFEKKEKKK